MAICPDVVELRGGLVVSVDALRIGWSLEERGFELKAVDDKLYVVPFAALTADDVAAIRAHRDELFRLASYRCPDVSVSSADCSEQGQTPDMAA